MTNFLEFIKTNKPIVLGERNGQHFTDEVKEFRWELNFSFDKSLLDQCDLQEETKEVFNNLDSLVSKCELDVSENKKTITLDYMLVHNDGPNLASEINMFVTSALINNITITVFNCYHEKHLKYTCYLTKNLPDWSIVFGSLNAAAKLRVVYNIDQILIS